MAHEEKNVVTATAEWVKTVKSQSQVPEDLQKLARIPERVLMDFSDQIAGQRGLNSNWVVETAGKEGIAVDDLESGLRVLVWTLLELPREVGIDRGIRALVEGGVVDSKLEELLTARFRAGDHKKRLKPVIDDILGVQSALDPTVPRLKGMWTRCIAVAQFDPEYNTDKHKPETYSPKVTGLVCAVSIQMDLDVFGEMDRVSFRLTAQELERMIKRLRLAQKQLLLLEGSSKSEDRRSR